MQSDAYGFPDVTRSNNWPPLRTDKAELTKRIKLATNELIANCPPKDYTPISSEESRLWALARTKFEEAALWAVKAATTSE